MKPGKGDKTTGGPGGGQTPRHQGLPHSVRYVRNAIPDKENREKDDFYATPPAGTRALLSVETFEGPIWEPACGDGAISRVLEAAGHHVTSTDLVDRGYGESRIDFLMTVIADHRAIITNPPFKLAEQFVRHAMTVRHWEKVAFLCRLAWLEGSARRKLFETTPLARVWVFSKRLNIQRHGAVDQKSGGGRGGMVAFAWYIWERGHVGAPRLGWIDPIEETSPCPIMS